MKSILISISLSCCILFSAHADVFFVNDIRVIGLQRVSSGSVFSAIDVSANTEVTDEQLQKVIKDLFATGYFDQVDVGRDGNVLVITVKERPVVAKIIIEGNKVIPEEGLLDALKSIGLVEGEVFKQSALDIVSKQLNAQYGALGRYSASIETMTRTLDQNQIVVGLEIDEGHVAKIKHINIVGNQEFKESKLQDLFSLNTTGTWSWITGSDKYAREKLAGDLERLKSFYLDRGYLRFTVTSTQVSLSPDKETVFITVNINEGEKYFVDSIDIAGDPVLPTEELTKLFLLKASDTFSQIDVTNTEQAIQKRLGNEGYSDAKVSGIPEIDDDNKKVALTFFVQPGSISYVRRISFSGNTSTADHVLRREMRQLEGAPVSVEKLEQSKLRLQRLGLFSAVTLNTKEVPGTTDQIDVEFAVIEQPTASVNLSIGYSGGSGVTLGAGLQHNNWLGSGNTFGFNVEKSRSETNYSVNFRNPYYTEDGVSRGIRLFFRERDFDEINVSNFATDTVGVRVTFGYPISETGRLSLGLGFENIDVEAGTTTAQEIRGTPVLRSGVDNAYISNDLYETEILPAISERGNPDTNNNGVVDEKDAIISGTELNDLIVDSSDVVSFNNNDAVVPVRPEGFLDRYGDSFDTFNVSLGWSNSSFNRGIFPTDGLSQRLDFEITLPGGDLEYYKLVYRNDWYFPVTQSSAFHFRGRLGYADAYGDIDELPFFENFFAGGIGSVRGFKPSTLGPKTTPSNAFVAAPVAIDRAAGSFNSNDLDHVYVLGNDGQLLSVADDDVDTYGGNILLELGLEFVFPLPFADNNDKLRTTIFVDSGNTFLTDCGPLQRNCGSFDPSKLSVATGIALQWLSPVGPLSFNFAWPLVEQPFDETESFQFSLGRSF